MIVMFIIKKNQKYINIAQIEILVMIRDLLVISIKSKVMVKVVILALGDPNFKQITTLRVN